MSLQVAQLSDNELLSLSTLLAELYSTECTYTFLNIKTCCTPSLNNTNKKLNVCNTVFSTTLIHVHVLKCVSRAPQNMPSFFYII